MENEPTTKTPIPATSGFRNFALCTLIFAFSTYLSCHEFIATEPPFLSMDYFSVFSAFSVAISFVPLCLSGHESIMQNKPNFLTAKTNATLSKPCHSDRRHASSVPKRRNLLQCSRYLPNRLFGPTCQRIMACIMQNKPNFLKANANATIFAAKVYENKPPRPHSKKQTQSNPIPRPQIINCQSSILIPRSPLFHFQALLQ
jgi:hypothetical protein